MEEKEKEEYYKKSEKVFFKKGDVVTSKDEGCEQPMTVTEILWQMDVNGKPKHSIFLDVNGKPRVRHYISGILCEYEDDLGNKVNFNAHSHELKHCK